MATELIIERKSTISVSIKDGIVFNLDLGVHANKEVELQFF